MILEDMENYLKASYAYLRSAWFFNDNQNREWMIKSRKKAIDCLLNNESTFKSAQTYLILVDCYRRIGDFESSLKALNQFDFNAITDEYSKKLYLFEKELSEKEDSCAHCSREVNERSL